MIWHILFGTAMIMFGICYGIGVWRDDREMRRVERQLAARIVAARRSS